VGNRPDKEKEIAAADRKASLGRKIATSLFRQPIILAGLITLLFFLVLLLGSHPGYEADDDISMLLLASGYLGGKAVPFLVFSNILWGFLLNLLYALPTRWNWEVLLFLLLNFISVYGLIHIVLARSPRVQVRAFAILIILLTDVFFLENINFTGMAAFNTLAGFCLLLGSLPSRSPSRFGQLTLGITLIVIGSLIRIEAALLVFLLLLVPLSLKIRAFKIPGLVAALTVAGMLVAGCVLFDHVYVQSSPAWSSYYQYNQTRSELHDTPRLAQIDGAIQEVGWSQNDLVMFIHWFFPDPTTYSLNHLQTLVADVTPVHTGLISTLAALLRGILAPDALPYLLFFAAIWLWAWRSPSVIQALLPLTALAAVFFGIGFFLEWSAKLPDRVLMSMLAAMVLIGLSVLLWSQADSPTNTTPTLKGLLSLRSASLFLVLLVAGAAILVTVQSLVTSHLHLQHQSAYRQILSDLRILRESGKVQKASLIVSPGLGLPLEWSDPMVLDLPEIEYMPMGWLTFSPVYETMLHQYGIASLPDGLWQKDNVYLMTRTNLMYGIRAFIREHGGPNTTTRTIYSLPPNTQAGSYQNVALFQFIVKKK